MKVNAIGCKEVYSVKPNTPLNEVASMMKRHGIGAVSVIDDEKLIGIITDRDIAIGCVSADSVPHECFAGDFMTSSPVTINGDMDIEEAAELMASAQVRRLPLVMGDTVVGMVSLGDLAPVLDSVLLCETLMAISKPVNP
jgi:CBS domain-containing protein